MPHQLVARGRNQHSHHDWAQAKHRTLDGGLFDCVTLHAKLINVLEHDDSGLYGDTE
jgi:hypothetical protein